MVKNNSLSKSNRLRYKIDFQNLRINSSSKTSKYFRVYYKKNTLDSARLAISISKKSGNAVFRNLMKRVVRECFRSSLNKNKGYDFIVTFHHKYKRDIYIKNKQFMINELYKIFNGDLQ